MTGKKKPVAVVALGGNALIREGESGRVEEQMRHIREATAHLPALLEKGYNLLITHGNGPIVGHLLLQNEAAKGTVPPMPLDVCDADSEGSIGYLTQQTLANRLRGIGGGRPAVSLITQIVVDRNDPAFARPTKPVGPFYTHQEAEALRRRTGWAMMEDAGRGFRRVVPSPRPLEVVEQEAIRILLEHGVIVIAAGGGGIPVVREENGVLVGIEAVIDKDLATSLLARTLGAEALIILTAVEHVYRGFGRPEQSPLARLTAGEARELQQAGEFPPGSMGPKIEAALEFLAGGGREVLITLPEALADALEGRTGTRIVP